MVRGLALSAIFTNNLILLKTILLIALLALITYVHTQIQPGLEELLDKIPENGKAPESAVKEIGALRLKRKKIGSICLFLVLSTVTLGVSLTTMLSLNLAVVIIALAALFSWRVYTSLLPFGLI